MRVREEDSSCVPGISDRPLSIDTDFLDRFPTAPSSVDADVQATDRLCLPVVGFKGIVTCEDFVKIDVSVKEDIVPLQVGNERASWESKYCTFGGFEIDGIIVFEFECEFEFRVNGGTYVFRVIEHVEGFIWTSLSGLTSLVSCSSSKFSLILGSFASLSTSPCSLPSLCSWVAFQLFLGMGSDLKERWVHPCPCVSACDQSISSSFSVYWSSAWIEVGSGNSLTSRIVA